MDYCTFNEVLTLTTIVDPCGFYCFCCCCFLLEWNNKCPGTWYAVVDLEFFFLLDMKSHQSSLLSGLRTSNILSNAHQPSKPLSYSKPWNLIASLFYKISHWYVFLMISCVDTTRWTGSSNYPKTYVTHIWKYLYKF